MNFINIASSTDHIKVNLISRKTLRYRRFTLIELLMVVAIICILAGLLLPVLSKAKAKSYQIECSNNLKQLGISSALYYSDYDGWLPNYYYGKGWAHTLASGLHPSASWSWGWLSGTPEKIKKLFQCKGGEAEIYYGVNYMYNKQLGYYAAGLPVQPYMTSKKITSIPRQSTKIQIIDGACKTNADIGVDHSAAFIKPVHTGGANVLWIDGHVKCQRYTEIVRYDKEWTP